MSSRTKAYLDFMDWLKDNYPEIHKNYHNNFNVPKNVGEGISVNDNFRITKEEFEMLDKIKRSYYDV
ncbi:MAG TPA: hypothetical protein VNT20_20270 [Flavisolibacter sp.]|jgi:hypothetical protein|nr:hypothetical protein [Flavisolibacter sp.]